ncbi:hypothetical protein [Pararhodonellum marinum]|uniref:hypothetical protein n=1 Tax=Pararhodonellum marinum TaxID=2755358 RepID=UPI00188F154F|nr:hypothetical protein [Pararhodonellum marinum]
MTKTTFLILFLFTVLHVSCKPSSEKSNIDLIEDFDCFRNKFYSDSIFQLSRVLFPLPGADSDVIYGDAKVEDQENEVFLIENNQLFWKRNGWRFIETPLENIEFVITREYEGSIVREKIRSKETDLVITLRFSLIKDQWMLTYYSHEWY